MSYYDKYKVKVPEGEKGDWSVERFEVKKSIASFRADMEGRGTPEGTYTCLRHKSRGIIMSDTHAEISDHSSFINKAKGRCLIHGLGLGMALGAILQKEEVIHVDVVELEQDVIDLVAPTYLSDSRVHIHQGDAYTFKFPKGSKWDFVWHDIWDNICTDNLPEMSKLHRRYGRMAGWQNSWCRERLKYIQSKEKTYNWYR